MSAPARERGLAQRAAAAAALLGAWFFLVYGLCNWWTSRRPAVGTFIWDWERRIPFIPEFIVPYMSIDLFFVAGFFLCRSRDELSVMNRRIFADITASGLLFLLFPLQLGIDRPQPEGWTAPVFAFLHAGDLPFNLAPSLHISLRALLWITYGRHLRGAWRAITKAWFMLVGLSTLLTWQHHLIDVATGFLMAWAVVALIPDRDAQPGPAGWIGQPGPAHARLARLYGAGAAACAAITLLPDLRWFFAWPAIALAVVALAYATDNPRFLQKSSGTLSPAAEWILLPVRLAARLWQHRWLRRQPAWTAASPRLLFGRKPDTREARALVAAGCVGVVDLTAEGNASVHLRERASYLNGATLDLTPPPPRVLREVLSFIEQHHQRGLVYVHCQLGFGRSATVAAAWLLRCGAARDADDAIARIRKAQPLAAFAADARALLADIERGPQ